MMPKLLLTITLVVLLLLQTFPAQGFRLLSPAPFYWASPPEQWPYGDDIQVVPVSNPVGSDGVVVIPGLNGFLETWPQPDDRFSGRWTFGLFWGWLPWIFWNPWISDGGNNIADTTANNIAIYRFIHWDLREMLGCTVPYSFSIGTTREQVAAVNEAFGQWQAVQPAEIGFLQVSTPAGALPLWSRDGSNMIGWAAGVLPFGVLAIASSWSNLRSGQILEADILFNSARVYDFQTVAMHEIGHFIGLAHPGGGCCDIAPNPIMSPFYCGGTRKVLEIDDGRGCNFLYNPDIGDAPDPLYPSRVRSLTPGRILNGVQLVTAAQGAEHIFGTKPQGGPDNGFVYEWLGSNVDGECESDQVNPDLLDDGITFGFPSPGGAMSIAVTVSTAADADGNVHDYVNHPLYLNIWVDWNCDGDWDDAGEQVVGPRQIVSPGTPGFQTFSFSVQIPSNAMCNCWWVRARLDWGEDCGAVVAIDPTLAGPRGPAQFGEVEDYYVCSPVCGNDILDPGEQCDDGNLVSGDGCSPVCKFEPIISVSPTSLSFGQVVVTKTSTPQTVTITNTGAGNLKIDGITITGTSVFEFGKQNDNCSGNTLAPPASCTLQALFSPTSLGPKSANLTIPSDDPNTPIVTVPMSGTGIAGKVTVTYPNGGETWKSGKQYTITWYTVATAQPVALTKVYVSANGGATWKLIKTLSGNLGSYLWTVPTVGTNLTKCRIGVVLLNASVKILAKDTSDANFTVEP